MGEIRSYTVNGDLHQDPLLLDDEGEVRVEVEITMPGTGRKTKVVIYNKNIFTEFDEPYLKDVIDVMLDQTSTYVRRHWERDVEPKMVQHR